MRIATILFLLLLTSLVCAQPENTQARKEMDRFYAKWDAAFGKMDVKTMTSMIDPSWVMVDAQGKQTTYAQMKQMFGSGSQSMRGMQSHIVVNQVQEQGNEVVAWLTVHESMKVQQGKKWVLIKQTHKVTETLKRVAGGWVVTYTQELPPEG